MSKNKFMFMVIFIFFTLQNICIVSAKPAGNDKPEQFATEFLCAKMYSLVSRNVDNIDKYYSIESPNAQKYMLFTKENLLIDYIIAYSSNDYIIEKVKPQVKIISCITNNNTSEIEAVLLTKIYWNASNALGKPIVGMKSEKHLLILNLENNEWKVSEDKYMTCRGHSDQAISEDLTRYSQSIERLKKDAEDSFGRAKHSKPTRLTFALLSTKASNKTQKLTDTVSQGHIFRTTPTNTYNRTNAYNWAYAHWNIYSTAFVNLGDNKWEGGDCANFVSQCLKAGGASNDKTGSYQWYYDNKGTSSINDDAYSWTWSTSRGLNNILLNNYKSDEFGPKGTEKVITGDWEYNSSIGKSIEPGDIIQYQWKQNRQISHTAIVVGMLYNSSKERYEPVIAEHTYDSWSTPWANNAYKTYFIHITGVNK